MPHELVFGRVPDNNSNTFVHEMARVIGRAANMYPRAEGNTTAEPFPDDRDHEGYRRFPIYSPLLPPNWSPLL